MDNEKKREDLESFFETIGYKCKILCNKCIAPKPLANV